MVARSREGHVTSYPVTETVHKSSICYVTQTPAQIPQELQDQARQMAEKTVSCLEGRSSEDNIAATRLHASHLNLECFPPLTSAQPHFASLGPGNSM